MLIFRSPSQVHFPKPSPIGEQNNAPLLNLGSGSRGRELVSTLALFTEYAWFRPPHHTQKSDGQSFDHRRAASNSPSIFTCANKPNSIHQKRHSIWRNLSCMWLSVQRWMSKILRNETRQDTWQRSLCVHSDVKRLEQPFVTLILAEKRQVIGSYTALVKQCTLVSSFHFERSEETTGREGHVDGASHES